MHCYTTKKTMAAFAVVGWISNQIIQAIFDIFLSLTTSYENCSSVLTYITIQTAWSTMPLRRKPSI